jgi:AcrR family transcriptional regulator
MTVEHDEVDEKIMDATLDRILQVGIRRASLEDIARRIGMNRATIHRRFVGKDNLIEAVLERETRRMLAEVTAIATTAPGVDAQIEETVLHVAPEEALTFYTVQGERLVGIGIDYIVGLLDHAQQAGVIARYDPRPIAELVARLSHSLMLTPGSGGSVDFTDHEQARRFVRTTLVPLIKYGITASPEDNPDDTISSSTHPASPQAP